jgi:hypothetical protein
LRKPDIDNDIDCEEIADNGEWITYGDVVDLLNEQDQRIKELEKSNKDYDNSINEIADILREAYEHGISNPYLKRIGKVKVENR